MIKGKTIPIGRKYDPRAQNIPIKKADNIEDLFWIVNIRKTLPQRKKVKGYSVRIILEESRLFGKNVKIIKNIFSAGSAKKFLKIK